MLKKGLIYVVFALFFQVATAKEIVHTIQEGETMSHIADKYNTPASKIKEANNKKTDVVWVGMKLTIPQVSDEKTKDLNKSKSVKSLSSVKQDQVKESKQISQNWLVHTFKEGDTLWSVARQYGVSGEEIKTLNNKKTDVVWIGMKLKIKEEDEPLKQESKKEEKQAQKQDIGSCKEIVHTIQEGETMSHIADKYNTPASKIKEANNKKTDVVWVGMKLTIPCAQTQIKSDEKIQKKEEATEVSSKPTYPTTSRVYKKVQHGIEFKHQGDDSVVSSLSGTVLAVVDTIDHLKPVVIIKHGSQTTIYGKLTKVIVKQGDRIKKGQSIGSYGAANGLYFAYRQNGEFSDPIEFLS